MSYIAQLNLPEKIDIYRLGLGFLLNKLIWDLKSESWKSKIKLKKLKNRYRDQKAVILCNGPSLNMVDFDELKRGNVFTVGLNKINLLFDVTDFRPSLIVSVNKHVIEQNLEFFNSTPIELVLDSTANKIVKKSDNICFIHSLPFQLKFARDITGSVCQGYTVTYVALQLLYHMGFSKVALVGCDHNFDTKGSANMTVEAGDSDPNHFSSKYFSGGVKWQLPDLLGSEVHYKMARDYYESGSRKIFNCTQGGKLEIFDRISLSQFLNEE